ncbi:tetratricopeptide repeat protein [Filobacillus milosensis]|uniref:Tetratricopeptide repeat protein n=1 Tax=Filobacillus milosensis TaxID=94137 RepID=A0A4Y8IRP0_9BACI|nr:tetratricopeptide repeat protein [Filobacillus milosensis]TFB24345.1 tetratricopeptide repeat protein [Filobacillus milosensis]
MQTSESKIIPYRHDGDFYFTYGVKAFKEKRFDRAEKWMLKALDVHPKNALYLSQLSVLYTEIGQYHRANDQLQKVIDLHGEDYADCYYLLANNYAHLGLFYEAKKYAEKYLEHHEDGEFKGEVQELLTMLNQLSADEDAEDDLELDDMDEIIIYQETAFYHLEHEEWDEALEVLEEMMTLYPEYLPAKHEYAYALFRSGDQEEAITLEEAWLDQDFNNLHSRLNLTYFYYTTGKNKEFQELLPSLNNVYPTYEPQKLKLAITLARVGEYEAALNRFKLINRHQVSNYMSYFYWYSKVLDKNNFHETSKKIWKQGIQKHPVLDSFR